MWGLRQGSLSIGTIMINRDQKLMIFWKSLIAHVVKYPFASGWKVPASPWWFLSLRWVYYGMFVESGGFNPTVMAFINEEMPINERMEWGDLFSDKSTLLFWCDWYILILFCHLYVSNPLCSFASPVLLPLFWFLVASPSFHQLQAAPLGISPSYVHDFAGMFPYVSRRMCVHRYEQWCECAVMLCCVTYVYMHTYVPLISVHRCSIYIISMPMPMFILTQDGYKVVPHSLLSCL